MIITNARMVLRDEVVLGSLCTDGAQIGSIDSGPSGVAGALDFEATTCCPAWWSCIPTTWKNT